MSPDCSWKCDFVISMSNKTSEITSFSDKILHKYEESVNILFHDVTQIFSVRMLRLLWK